MKISKFPNRPRAYCRGQEMKVAAMQMTDMKAWAQWPKRVDPASTHGTDLRLCFKECWVFDVADKMSPQHSLKHRR